MATRGHLGGLERAAVALALGALCGCAPTTLAPSIIGMSPMMPNTTRYSLGLRTGPRLAAPVTGGLLSPGNGGSGAQFFGDAAPFSLTQWGFAYDASLARALGSSGLAFHLGAQGEFAYPLPLPAYGLFVGLSRAFRFGRLSVTPAFAVRGATDFGISVLGGSGTQVGAELSATIAWHADENGSIGVAPFVTVVRQWSRGVGEVDLFAGAVLVGHFEFDGTVYELSGGAGRVYSTERPSWTSPLIGFSTSR